VSALPDPPAAVSRQLDAYNRRDLAPFVACYTDDVVLEDGDKGVFARGKGELEQRYAALFREHPENRATVLNRSLAPPWVFEEELVERDQVAPDGKRTPTKRRVLVVYKLAGELIARAIFYRAD
jgi:hypothetical protein